MSARIVDFREDEYGTYEDVAPSYADTRAGGSTRKRSLLRLGYVDYPLILIVFFLIIFGLIMLYSTSSYQAELKFSDDAYYLKRQMAVAAAGLFIMFFLSYLPDYHVYKNLSLPALLFAAGLIILIIPFGYEGGGAKRWLYIGSVSIQPAEVAKIAMIIFLASLLTSMRDKAATWKGFAVFLTAPLIMAAMIYFITENFSSAVIVMGIAIIMLFVCTPGYRKILFIVIGVLAAAVGGIYLILNYADPNDSVRFARIFAWSDLEADATDYGYQTLQSLYAIGSGGVFGKGLGESIQKTGFIPEAQNDMIFSIICEELGLFGGFAVIIMFAMLLWRMMIIANNARDLFGSLLVVGVMAHISIQVILNIAVVTNVIPNTGITLPFISYGGSAMIMLLTEFGIVMNVARRI